MTTIQDSILYRLAGAEEAKLKAKQGKKKKLQVWKITIVNDQSIYNKALHSYVIYMSAKAGQTAGPKFLREPFYFSLLSSDF